MESVLGMRVIQIAQMLTLKPKLKILMKMFEHLLLEPTNQDFRSTQRFWTTNARSGLKKTLGTYLLLVPLGFLPSRGSVFKGVERGSKNRLKPS